MLTGITGGIASGKSTVARILEELGAEIIDADEIAHQLLEKGRPGWEEVVEHFGPEIIKEDGKIDRRQLGKIVFNDQSELRVLENITHPRILAEIKERINLYQGLDKPLFLMAPLLFETGLDRLVDQIWVIYVDRETQFKRLQTRDRLTREGARKRIEAQISLEKKRELADLVIDNNGSREELEIKIKEIWKDY